VNRHGGDRQQRRALGQDVQLRGATEGQQDRRGDDHGPQQQQDDQLHRRGGVAEDVADAEVAGAARLIAEARAGEASSRGGR
jgi:hypothetical protein